MQAWNSGQKDALVKLDILRKGSPSSPMRVFVAEDPVHQEALVTVDDVALGARPLALV